MNKQFLRVAALAATPILCFAVSTRVWLSTAYSDFEKGELKGVSVRSDGRITLAPRTTELFDSGLAYVWALVRDSKGVIYAGGGPGARVLRFEKGKSEKVAEFDAVEVHALAIDKQDRVYAATFPDGRIYRLIPGKEPQEFYNPKTKYIWSMLFDPQGNLMVATGDTGEIHRVKPDGTGEVFFRSGDSHVRSLAWAGHDLIAGTDPTGLVMRIGIDGNKATGFVVYQLPKREVTAVAVARDGNIYAAGAGVQQPAPGASALLNALAAAASAAVQTSAVPGSPEKPAAEAPAPPRAPALTGGSEVYRIEPSGQPLKVWSHPRDVVYAIAFDQNGLPLLGSGNKGILYRVETPALSTALTDLNSNQITSLLTGADGSILAATANVGMVYRFGPELESEGTVTSDVFDSGAHSKWGKLNAYGDSPAGTTSLESHSGNLDRPREYWSPWTAGPPPPARFVQWRATLKAAHGNSPILDSVEQYYLPRNVAPHVDEIESTPPNYKFPAPLVQAILQRTPASLTLPAMGKRANPALTLGSESDSSTMAQAKGWMGVRWTAGDDNGDTLLYTLRIRGVKEAGWQPLKGNLSERHYSFDSTAYPDGEYRILVTATDQPGNPEGDALTGQLESAPLLIDNTPPAINGLAGQVTGTAWRITWKTADALSVIKRAEYTLDGEDWTMIEPRTGLSDSRQLDYAVTLQDVSPGEHVFAVRVADDYDNIGNARIVIGK